MRVGFLTETRAWGGTEVHTLAVARRLASRDHVVTVVQLGHDVYGAHADAPTADGVMVVTEALPMPIRALPTRFWRRLLDRHGFDMVVAVKGSYDARYPALDRALLPSRRGRLAIEHSIPDDPEPTGTRRGLAGLLAVPELWRYRVRAEAALHRAAFPQVIAVAHAVKRRLVDQCHYSADRVTVVHNGVDPSEFRFDAALRTEARRRWRIPESAFLFGTVARLSVEKRLDRILHAFHSLAGESDAHLVVVGGGPEAAALQALSAALGLDSRCHWPGASIDTRRDHPAIDCFMLSSEGEGMPLALLEAMACERAVVAMDAGGVREVVIDGVTGWLIGQDTPALERAMRSAMTASATARGEIGLRAREHVIAHHDERTQVGEVARIIERECGVAGTG